MNLSDVILLNNNGLLANVDFSPAINPDGALHIYQAHIWIRTPENNKFVQFPFHTDRPFLEVREVIHLFHTAGVPKSRIHLLAPFGTCNYKTAEVL